MPIFIFSPKNNEKGNGSLRNRWKNQEIKTKNAFLEHIINCDDSSYGQNMVMNSVLLGKVHAAYSKADFSKAAAEKWSTWSLDLY